VAGRVDDDDVVPRQPQPRLGDVDRYRLVALGLDGVDRQRPLQRHAAPAVLSGAL
jgi:hypothetical protein